MLELLGDSSVEFWFDDSPAQPERAMRITTVSVIAFCIFMHFYVDWSI